MKIPFMDLPRQYKSIKAEVDMAIKNVIDNAEFIGGEAKTNFEKNFSRLCGVKHCIGVGNGTDAIFIALKAMGIGPGDEVLVPVNSFIATSEAVTAIGAKPVFIDVEPKSYLIDLNAVEKNLSTCAKSEGGKVRAIIPVHLYGRICPMPQIMELAKKYKILVLEDSAQAHLAEIAGKKAGAHGHMATFSFYPGKNLGAFGDAGAIVTNDDVYADKAKKLANHGRVSKYDHEMEGFNSRLDGLQAAVLNVKMRHLPSWTETRRKLARRYNELLSYVENKIDLPYIPEGKEHVFHLYVIRVKNREALQKALEAKGVQTIVHYPIALHNLKAYAHFNHKPEDFPVANRYQNEILSLPLFPEMTEVEQKHVAQALIEAL
jgi:dTDP-4-amino-4,6-dideoxygalactose transaminase